MLCRAVVLCLALQVASAFRIHKKASRASVKHIAGVPVYNSKSSATDWTLMLKPEVSEEQLQSFCEGSSVTCFPEGHAGGIPFVEVLCSEAELEELLVTHKDLVAFAEPDFEMKIIPELPSASSSAASWGLDRVGTSKSSKKGQGVHVYVLDTGVHTGHNDFGGRAIPTLEVTSSTPQECQGSTSCAKDVHGHGTHCAGTVGGTTYGVAPKSSIHGVKVLSDDGYGQGSWTVSAIDWVMTRGERPAVISMSLGAPGISQADKVAIDRATNAGVTVVVAAGNENSDACQFSPAFVPSAITVGSTTSRDSRSWFSNFGSCVNIYAPGSDIKSAAHGSNSGSATMSGTSMACPHVSGAAALLLESNPDWKSTQVLEKMLNKAVSGAVSDLRSGDPNKLLFVGDDDSIAPTSAPAPAPIGQCIDTDNGAKDEYGDGCAEYADAKSWCGLFDSSSFKSEDMCCVCGGGETSSLLEVGEVNKHATNAIESTQEATEMLQMLKGLKNLGTWQAMQKENNRLWHSNYFGIDTKWTQHVPSRLHDSYKAVFYSLTLSKAALAKLSSPDQALLKVFVQCGLQHKHNEASVEYAAGDYSWYGRTIDEWRKKKAFAEELFGSI